MKKKESKKKSSTNFIVNHFWIKAKKTSHGLFQHILKGELNQGSSVVQELVYLEGPSQT